MSTVLISSQTAVPARSRRGWLAVIAVTVALFAIITTEILPIGLLTSIAGDFTISEGMAGLMMTMPGLVAAVAAPVVTVAAGRIDRRFMLGLFIFLLMLANVLVAVAPEFWVVLVSRVLIGITVGGFWSIAAGLAVRLVPEAGVARANSVIFAAVPLGSVVGVPAGTFLGGIAGWRMAFVVLAVLSAVALGMLVALLPSLPAGRGTRVAVLRGLIHGVNMRYALLLTFLIVLAHFGAYTYVTPFLEKVTRVDSMTVTVLLLVYGVAGLAGNFFGGTAVAHRPRAAFAVFAAMIAAAVLLLPILGHSEIGAVALLIVWGIGYGAVPVSTQTWFGKAAPETPEAAAVLFTASFQATLSLGALTGGIIVDHSSPSTVLLLAGGLTVLVIVVIAAHSLTGRTWPDRP
ncbi:MFS transporter [Nocardia crassostreae]|uniref:MFS transporter n=1 Tax=Nocardia crassostreae TaxID=53428 RepID=UPI00082C8B0A|nr:MFS transporter [Nocardia crassostreae]